MKYALISDIHGNVYGLKAAVEDARRLGADRLLFLGDYTGDLPFVNECVGFIRSIPGAICVRGNKEDYFREIQALNPDQCRSEQYAPMLYSFEALHAGHREWLDALPEKILLHDPQAGAMILGHRLRDLVGDTSLNVLTSGNLARRIRKAPFAHDEYLAHAQALTDREDAFASPDSGAYLFGDSHVQWYARRDGGILVNPGSCGLPLDGDPTAKYTLLEGRKEGWHVTERQVYYDVEAAVTEYSASGMFARSPIWGRMNLYKLRTGIDLLYLLFHEIGHLSDRAGTISDPHGDEAWREAGERVLSTLSC